MVIKTLRENTVAIDGAPEDYYYPFYIFPSTPRSFPFRFSLIQSLCISHFMPSLSNPPWLLPLGVASCCTSIQLVPYDAVSRNKVSICQFTFIFLLTHYMFRPLRAIFRWDTQLDNGLFLIQRIHCTYAIWCRDVTCCTSVLRLCIPNTCYHLNKNCKYKIVKSARWVDILKFCCDRRHHKEPPWLY
jgi:hypothetical protein